MNKKNNNKGFTLAELLIVVAIIAVLVAIAIPVFTSQLEKSREATDAANIRSQYAEVIVKVLEDPQAAQGPFTYTCKQKQGGWQNTEAKTSLNSLAHTATATDTADVTTTVSIDNVTANGTVTFTYSVGSASSSPSLAISAS